MVGKPPILFRTASDQSRGLNTAHDIDPLYGYQSEYHVDLASVPLPTARHMIYDHIDWNYKTASEFSSWSVSLLYVLVHAVCKTYSEDETNVLIYVMSTRDLPASRIYTASKAVKDYDVTFGPNLLKYSQGEYLIHGKLSNTEGLWQAVRMEDLITAGFWKVFPSLRDDTRQHLLFQRVQQLRFAYFNRAWQLNPDILASIHKLAHCFGDAWEGPVTIALVAIRHRDFSPETVAELLSEIGSTQLPQLPWSSNAELRMFWHAVRDIPESCQFMQLLRLLDDAQTHNRLAINRQDSNSHK